MSPVNPISPISPVSISPMDDSPTTTRPNDQMLDTPSSPIIKPSIHLPQLITSFNTTSNINHIRRSSIQFILNTPSPLKLRETPITAIRDNFSENDKRGGVVSIKYNSSTAAQSPNLHPATAESILESDFLPVISLRASGNQPKPELEEGEDFEYMDIPTRTPVAQSRLQLPLRINTELVTFENTYSFGRFAHTKEDSNLATSGSESAISTSSQHNIKEAHTSIRRRKRSPSPSRTKLRRCRSYSSQHDTQDVIHLVVRTPDQIHLSNSIAHLRTPLVPLISVRTGLSHPAFPVSLLQYHLLSHSQLDSLARWYHQTLDGGIEGGMYPAPIGEDKAWTFSSGTLQIHRERLLQQRGQASPHLDLDLDTKRRRWGRFIGLRGCESPEKEAGDEEPVRLGQEENIADRMEREWREALRRSEEESRLRDKIWRSRF